MNARPLCIMVSLALTQFAFGSSETNQPASATTATSSSAVTVTQQASQTSAPAETEPAEAEMREAVQRHLDSITAQTRPPPAPSTSSSSHPKYVYSPYWHYYDVRFYQKDSRDSQYENWQDVARRANATARVEITSFKRIRCAAAPDEGGFSGEYVAELELRGASNPAAAGIMQTSGKRLKGFFYKGDKGWIFGEAPSETK
ncbi:MAG TPA: hypothetical protein VL171_07140 [Verrucomicrobiae bacterium]|nr:hypothetical protein [Verrucomicrobiae bacterium]